MLFWKLPAKNFLTKVTGCFLPIAILPKMKFFCGFFFSFLYGYFYLLLSLKLFSEKKSLSLKLTNLIVLLPRLDQSNEIHFAASWWALIIKGRCNTLCSNDISLNVTLIATTWLLLSLWLLADKLKNVFEGSGEKENTATKLFPYCCHFQITSVEATYI